MSTEETTLEEAKPSPPAKKERRKKWRRRFFILVTAGVVVGLSFRLLLQVLFPVALDRVARVYGLNAEYDKLDLSLLGGDVGLWGLRFTPLEGGQPVVTTSYCRGAISTLSLFKLELHVKRVEAEDAEVVVERLPDGTLPLIERVIASSQSRPTAAPTASTAPPTLDPPLTIDALRLQNARLRFRDGMMSPATDVTMQMNLLVGNIGSTTLPTHVELQLNSPEMLGALYVTAKGASRNNQVDADLSVKMIGLNLLPAQAYLAPLGILPRSEDLSATAQGKLTASLLPDGSGVLQASLTLDDITLRADSVEAGAIKKLHIDAREVSPGAIRISKVDIAGVHAKVARTERGTIAFGGIELCAGPVSQTTTATASVPVSPTTAPVAVATGMPIVELDRIDIQDISLIAEDRAVQPLNVVRFHLPTLLLEHLSTDPAKENTPARLALSASAPGIAERITVDGDIAAAPQVKTAAFKVAATGISADALSPYLLPLGVGESFDNGTFGVDVKSELEARDDGVVRASIEVKEMKLSDGTRSVVEMPRVAVRDASFDARANAIHLGDVELVGPTMPIRREKDGTVRLLGLHTLAARPAAPNTVPDMPATSPTTSAVEPTTSTASAAIALPSLELSKLAWHGSNITLDDQAAPGAPLQIAFDDMTASIENLMLSNRAESKPGAIAFAMRSPGVIEALDVSGTLSSGPSKLGIQLSGRSTGITLDRIRPLLAQIGIEPAMRAGAFQFAANASIQNDAGTFRADMDIQDAKLADGDVIWLELARAGMSAASFDGSQVSIAAIEVEKPAALVSRNAEGEITIAGMKLIALPASEPSTNVAPAVPMPTRVDLSLPIVGRLGAVRVNDAKLRLRDDFVLPTADVNATLSASIDNIVVGEAADPATFGVRLASAGVVEQLTAEGHFSLAPTRQSLDVLVAGTGLDGRAIEAYLPPNIGVNLAGRSVAAKVKVVLAHEPAGGSTGLLEVADAQIGLPGAEVDTGVRAIRAAIARVDLPGKVITVDELAIEGARLEARQDDAGLHVAGLTLSPTPLREVRVVPPPAEVGAAATASDVAQLVRSANESMPLFQVNRLSLNADRLAFRSAVFAEPMVVSEASLASAKGPLAFGGPQPAELPPMHVVGSLRLERLIHSLKIDATAAPFATEPMAVIAVDASGIDGRNLTAFVPSLSSFIDASDSADARFRTNAEAQFKFSRRGAMGIDLTRDITAEVTIKDTSLSVAGQDRPLVGVEEVSGRKIRYAPATGSVTVGSLEVSKPIASVVREADGVHVAGLTVKVLLPASSETTQPTTEPSSAESQLAAADRPIEKPVEERDGSSASESGTRAAAEMRIDRLTVSGVDFRIEDRVNTPHSVIPVTDLDVEVVGLSTRALTEPRPVRFSGVASAGTVPLPPRKLQVGVETEDRAMFAEASANGSLTIYPKPTGYIRGSVSGFELTGVRGIASEYGITLGGGTFDGRLDVRMKSADTFEAKVYPSFNELRLKEAPNGPIQSTFSLPIPPDIAISTIEDADGTMSLPFTVPIDAGNVKIAPIVASAVGSASKQMVAAIAAAPLKAGKLAGGLLGMDMTSDRVKGLEPVVIEFAPGESQLSAEQVKALTDIRNLMRDDETIAIAIQHELGSEDVDLADERVNLASDDSNAIAQQLLSRKHELQRRYTDESAELTVVMLGNDAKLIEASQARLRETATQLKRTEDGLDTVFDLLRPGADRQATRRTKAAAILLADLRLQSVQDWLLAAKIKGAPDRVRRSNALFNPLESGPGRIRIVLTHQAKS